MLHELSQFPVRPTRLMGESLYGYVLRCYGSNGHAVPALMHKALIAVLSPIQTVEREHALQLVYRVVGRANIVDHDLWLGGVFSSSLCEHKQFGWRQFKVKRVKLCPTCLSEHGFHWGAWQLPDASACLVHAVQLVGQCQCRELLAWRGIGPDWRCRCGRLLARMTAPTASPAQLALTKMIQNATGIPLPSRYQQITDRDRPIARQDLAACYANMEFIYGLKNKIDRKPTRVR